MNTRWKIAVASALAAGVAAVATAALVGGDNDVATATVPPDSTAATEKPPQRSITVTGHGTVDVVPDIADLSMGVQATAPTGKEVMTTVEQKSQQLVDALKRAGIDEKDIQTSGLSLYPNYSRNGNNITGYTASVDVDVRARDIDQVGELLDAVQGMVGEGLTIGGISFSYESPEAVLEQARVAAIDNARTRAQQYAGAAGAEVGDVLKIVEISSAAPPVPYEMRAAAADGAIAIQPGSQELSADVSVVFAME
jgi:uncharacterized protein